MILNALTTEFKRSRNLVVNGDFLIWPRGESFTVVGDDAFHYNAAMWCVYASSGQTVKIDKTSDGLTFSGTSAIMQRIKPLKSGKKYIFLARVDGDVKTLQITGGTYIENSFLKYNKSGSYEQLQIKSNGNTKVGNVRLWEGTIINPIEEEDYATALIECLPYCEYGEFSVYYGNDTYYIPGFTYKSEKLDIPRISIVSVVDDSGNVNGTFEAVAQNKYSVPFIRLNCKTAVGLGAKVLNVRALITCEPLL